LDLGLEVVHKRRPQMIPVFIPLPLIRVWLTPPPAADVHI